MAKKILKKDIKVKLLYLNQGFNNDYPLGFLTPQNCVLIQTTELSHNNSPRYCSNINSSATISIGEFGKEFGGNGYYENKLHIALYTKKELYLALKLEDEKTN